MCKSLVYITDMKVLTPLFPNGFVAFVIFYFLYFGRKFADHLCQGVCLVCVIAGDYCFLCIHSHGKGAGKEDIQNSFHRIYFMRLVFHEEIRFFDFHFFTLLNSIFIYSLYVIPSSMISLPSDSIINLSPFSVNTFISPIPPSDLTVSLSPASL